MTKEEAINKIETFAGLSTDNRGEQLLLIKGGHFGYFLADQECAAKEKRIKELEEGLKEATRQIDTEGGADETVIRLQKLLAP